MFRRTRQERKAKDGEGYADVGSEPISLDINKNQFIK